MIEELCNGKSAMGIEREYGVKRSTVMGWLEISLKRYFWS